MSIMAKINNSRKPRDIWTRCMMVGRYMGCHQRPDRSFFYKNKQFPICARCTGVYIGQTIAIIVFLLNFKLNLIICMFFCAVMFVDWFVQKIKIKESTNFRRLITGLLGGYGYSTIFCIFVEFIILKFILKQ